MTKAHWIQRAHILRPDEYICSNCGGNTDRRQNECPYCGAEMRGIKYDPFEVDEMEMLEEIFND